MVNGVSGETGVSVHVQPLVNTLPPGVDRATTHLQVVQDRIARETVLKLWNCHVLLQPVVSSFPVVPEFACN